LVLIPQFIGAKEIKMKKTFLHQRPSSIRRLSAPFLGRPKKNMPLKGFTLLEGVFIVAILGTLITLMIPAFSNLIQKSRNNKAVSDIATISRKLEDNFLENGAYPETLAEVGVTDLNDPWGNPYQYLPIYGKAASEVTGKWRKDRFLNPLNSDFDLYSMGKDEDTKKPLTAKASWDDIVRANNGEFIGLGSKY